MTPQTFHDPGGPVQAMQYTAETADAVLAWIPADRQRILVDGTEERCLYVLNPDRIYERVWFGDWVIRDAFGWFAMRPATFQRKYERTEVQA